MGKETLQRGHGEGLAVPLWAWVIHMAFARIWARFNRITVAVLLPLLGCSMPLAWAEHHAILSSKLI